MNDSSSSIAQSILEFIRRSVPGYGIRGGFGVAALLMTLTLGYNSDSQTFAADHPAVAEYSGGGKLSESLPTELGMG